ncbi:hypothetical protein DFQ27_001148, partial [Actinomortierella ambigua]
PETSGMGYGVWRVGSNINLFMLDLETRVWADLGQFNDDRKVGACTVAGDYLLAWRGPLTSINTMPQQTKTTMAADMMKDRCFRRRLLKRQPAIHTSLYTIPTPLLK